MAATKLDGRVSSTNIDGSKGLHGPHLPYGPKFSQFHAVFFGNFGKTIPWKVDAPSYGESWIRP